jgi:ABC-type lipoprotein release transport system permease subunit
VAADFRQTLRSLRRSPAFTAAVIATIGRISAAGLARFLASLLYGVKPDDPVSFLVVPLVLGSVAFVAAWIPAVRASRVDPSVALRAE